MGTDGEDSLLLLLGTFNNWGQVGEWGLEPVGLTDVNLLFTLLGNGYGMG